MIKFEEIMPSFLSLNTKKFYNTSPQSTQAEAKPILKVPEIDLGIPEDQFQNEIKSLRERDNATDDEINQAIDLAPEIKDKEVGKNKAREFLASLTSAFKSREIEIKPEKKEPQKESPLLEFSQTLALYQAFPFCC